ncbi:MAG: hypothetical protein ACRDNF_19795 [Streptosporangiaceae bacterium]
MVPVPCRLSPAELDQLIEHTSALTAVRWMLPADLYAKLDSFRADLLAEREDLDAPRA